MFVCVRVCVCKMSILREKFSVTLFLNALKLICLPRFARAVEHTTWISAEGVRPLFRLTSVLIWH